MRSIATRLRHAVPVALILALLLVPGGRNLAVAARAGGPDASQLQRAFAQASRQFHVPEALLLAVAYNESLWEQHGGVPSTSGGYGIMQLTHADRIWDAAGRGGIHSTRHDPTLHTLDRAARLLGLPLWRLARDPVQNVRGGAALLAAGERAVTGHLPQRITEWYAAVAAYSGSPERVAAAGFADTVFATIRHGARRVTAGGQRVVLAAEAVTPDRATLSGLHLRPEQQTSAECPRALACQFVPAAYAVNTPSDPTDYGNYDSSQRPGNGLAIRYIVIHDTEGSYNAAIGTFQNPGRYASANYVIRSSDGQVTQMVPNEDIAWHDGNYWFNMHAIGIEHEGVAVQGATWYSEPMYQASARLVRWLAHRYGIPLDRQHIIGHEEVPGPTPKSQTTQHWDPGPFWDWGHFMDLLGAPIVDTAPPSDTGIVTIDPIFSFNTPPLTACSGTGSCPSLPAQPSTFVYLYTRPDTGAPLIADPALHGPSEVGTTKIDDWGDKAATGEQFVAVARQGDWVEIDFGGQLAWFQDPDDAPTAVNSSGQIVTPRPGLTSIPVYGVAYPERSAYPLGIKPQPITKLQYTIPAGQSYVSTDTVTADFYYSPTQTRHAVISGKTRYDVISFNHRLALVKAGDVVVKTVG